MNSMAFVWYWDRASHIMPYWRDGLRAAIDLIAKTRHVGWYLDEQIPLENYYDFILFWGDSLCPFFKYLDRYTSKKGIILTTDPIDFDNLRKVDVVFCESTPVYDQVRAQGIHAVKAFGTDTSFYSPTDEEKDIEYFYPATFSPWKRQSALAYLGSRLLCVGTVQPDGVKELEACKNAGVRVEEGYFPAEKIRDYYRRTEKIIIPAVHGSERTVLEAMANNIVPDVNQENIRTFSYIKEFMASEYVFPRDFIVANYSQKQYAEKILKGAGV